METKLNNNKEWIRIPSQSRPGHHYLFNVETGESKWCPSNDNVTSRNRRNTEALAVHPTDRLLRTPAQNRLKRLQHNLRCAQKPFQKHADIETNKSYEYYNASDMPCTSSNSHCLPRPMVRNTRMSSKLGENRKIPSYNSGMDLPKKLKFTDKNKRTSSAATAASTSPKEYSENNCNNALSTIGIGLVKKIKEICKRPFTHSSQQNKKNIKEEDEDDTDSSGSSESGKREIAHKNKKYELRNTVERALRGLTADNGEKNSHINELHNSSDSSNTTTATTVLVPCTRNFANTRLQQIRQALTEGPSTSKATAVTATGLAVKANYSQDSNRFECELMDWQPIIKSEPIEISDSETDIYTTNGQKASSQSYSNKVVNTSGDTATIMADLYDTLNENLLRISMERSKDLNNDNNETKWLKDHYYFILDTNVLLEHLSFIEDLSKINSLVTKGIVLYLPYCVLQELDKLKQGFGKHESVKTLAVRAIKYLNDKFETKSPNLAGQSAMEEKRHLIKIHSADDGIINCCLQVKKNVSNVILLTEDINLRNKAICNDIIVTTKADLLAKHCNSDGNVSKRSMYENNSIISNSSTNNNSCINNKSNSNNNSNSNNSNNKSDKRTS